MFGQLGRFHNIMSNETIGTLAFLTSGQTQKCNSLGAAYTFSEHASQVIRSQVASAEERSENSLRASIHICTVCCHASNHLFFYFPDIKGIFVHPFLAERIISMLNYFLQHLVGPKMGALKVKDFSEFDFKPQQLVSDICTIYLNLGYVVANPLAQAICYRSFLFRVNVCFWFFFVPWTVMKRISALQSQRMADRTLLPCFPRQLEY